MFDCLQTMISSCSLINWCLWEVNGHYETKVTGVIPGWHGLCFSCPVWNGESMLCQSYSVRSQPSASMHCLPPCIMISSPSASEILGRLLICFPRLSWHPANEHSSGGRTGAQTCELQSLQSLSSYHPCIHQLSCPYCTLLSVRYGGCEAQV